MSILDIQQIIINSLSPLDLSIGGGECVCLSGASGSGKSLLLRAIADLDPHQGEALLDGQACQSMTPTAWRRQVGLLQAESQWWASTVAEHMTTAKVPDSWLQRLGLGKDICQRKVAELSTGERQRLALLRLLANQPKALLLDEPTASLDPESTAAMEALIQEYREQYQVPVLWVSHQPEQIKRVASRHLRLEQQQIREVSL
jgi:ABC-type iron transport system FetAB ATPase subunit